MRFLHTRGGVSNDARPVICFSLFSPHTWRCFHRRCVYSPVLCVFSTHVEVFPTTQGLLSVSACFLHTRGGVSMRSQSMTRSRRFSPHTWRCFHHTSHQVSYRHVFSTHVEVFLFWLASASPCSCFLHTRGGVSAHGSYVLPFETFSPHTWRCF